MTINSVALDLADTASQRWLDPKTEAGKEWDRCVGISQRAINKQLEQLFKNYPEMSEMYNVDNEAGIIDAKLRAPSILIPGGNNTERSKVMFQLKFESGRMQSSDGVSVVDDLSDWIISSLIQIDIAKAAVTDDMSEEAKTKAAKLNKWLDKVNVPGDYSIERLYLKLSSIRWDDFDKDNTYCGVDKDGKLIPFKQWESEDSGRSLRLSNWLNAWASRQEQAGRNMIGLSFGAFQDESPAKPFYDDSSSADLITMTQSHQSYPYLSKPQGAPEGSTGSNGAGGCNALVYTEMASQNNVPASNDPLLWSGNFSTLPTTADGSGAIDGTLILGPSLLFNTKILPNLKRANQNANSIAADQDTPSVEDPVSTQVDFSLKSMKSLSGDAHPEHYSFSLDSSGAHVWGMSYEASPMSNSGRVFQGDRGDSNAGIQGGIGIFVDRTVEAKMNIETYSSLLASDDNNLKYSRGWRMSRTESIEDAFRTSATSSHKKVVTGNNYTVEFKTDIRLAQSSTPEGNGTFQLARGSGTQTTVTMDKGNGNRLIEPDLSDDLEELKPELQRHLISELNKYYPSWILKGGALQFGSVATFGKFAGMIVPVTYKAITKIEGYFLPRPPKSGAPVGGGGGGGGNPDGQSPDKGTNTGGGGGDTAGGTTGTAGDGAGSGGGSGSGTPGLSWAPIDSISALKKGKIVLRGTNLGQSKFKQIGIDFTSGQRGSNIFEEDQWAINEDQGGGIVRLQSQLSQGENVSLAPIRTLGSKYLLTLSSAQGNSSFKMQPGDWIEIELEGLVGGPNTYTININEITDDATSVHHKTPMHILVQ